jgi:hypothetical protein
VIQELAARLQVPGMPEWFGLAVLIVLAVVVLAYMAMPFAVFGVKGRLDAIEAQLDEVQTEIRSLTMRFPEGGRRRPVEDDWAEPVGPPRADPPRPPAHPPVPPPAAYPGAPHRPTRVEPRSEPRLDWPRDRR